MPTRRTFLTNSIKAAAMLAVAPLIGKPATAYTQGISGSLEQFVGTLNLQGEEGGLVEISSCVPALMWKGALPPTGEDHHAYQEQEEYPNSPESSGHPES